MALEDEREEIKVVRKKNANNIRDLQRQLQQSKRYDSMRCVCGWVCGWVGGGGSGGRVHSLVGTVIISRLAKCSLFYTQTHRSAGDVHRSRERASSHATNHRQLESFLSLLIGRHRGDVRSSPKLHCHLYLHLGPSHLSHYQCSGAVHAHSELCRICSPLRSPAATADNVR